MPKTDSTSSGRPRDDHDLDVHAPPWNRNPSAWSQRIPICLFAFVGFVIASYMALFQWGLIDTVWDPFFGEGTANVLTSDVSKKMHHWFGVPDAAFGAFAYLGDAVFGLAGSKRRWQYRPWLVLIFGFDVIPLGVVSVILVILQGTVVGSWCFLCLVSAVISLILIPMAADEVWSTLAYLKRVWDRTQSPRTVWKVFCGGYSAEAEAVALDRARDGRHADVATAH